MAESPQVNLHKNLSLREARKIARDHGVTVKTCGYGDLMFQHPAARRYVRVHFGRKDAGPDLINLLKYATGQKTRGEHTMKGFQVQEKLIVNTKRHKVAVILHRFQQGITLDDMVTALPGNEITRRSCRDTLHAMGKDDLAVRDGDLWRPTPTLHDKMPDDLPFGWEALKLPGEAPPALEDQGPQTAEPQPAAAPEPTEEPAAEAPKPLRKTNKGKCYRIQRGSNRYYIANVLVQAWDGLTSSEIAEALGRDHWTGTKVCNTLHAMAASGLVTTDGNQNWTPTALLLDKLAMDHEPFLPQPHTQSAPPAEPEPPAKPVAPPTTLAQLDTAVEALVATLATVETTMETLQLQAALLREELEAARKRKHNEEVATALDLLKASLEQQGQPA